MIRGCRFSLVSNGRSFCASSPTKVTIIVDVVSAGRNARAFPLHALKDATERVRGGLRESVTCREGRRSKADDEQDQEKEEGKRDEEEFLSLSANEWERDGETNGRTGPRTEKVAHVYIYIYICVRAYVYISGTPTGWARRKATEGTRGRGDEGEGDKNDNHRHFNNMQRHSRLPRRASAATMALYNDKDTSGSAGCLSLDKRRGVRVILPDRSMFCPARTNVTDNVLPPEPAAVKVKITVRAENIVVKVSRREIAVAGL